MERVIFVRYMMSQYCSVVSMEEFNCSKCFNECFITVLCQIHKICYT